MAPIQLPPSGIQIVLAIGTITARHLAICVITVPCQAVCFSMRRCARAVRSSGRRGGREQTFSDLSANSHVRWPRDGQLAFNQAALSSSRRVCD
jgi:hypothetical protein